MFRRVASRAKSALLLIVASIRDPRLFSIAWEKYRNRAKSAVEAIKRARRTLKSKGRRELSTRSFDEILKDISASIGILEINRTEHSLLVGVSSSEIVTSALLLRSVLDRAVFRARGSMIDPARISGAKVAIHHGEYMVEFLGDDKKGKTIFVEAYEEREPGKWVSRSLKNKWLRAVYKDVFSSPGIATAKEILSCPILLDKSDERPVDIVYTWVNHADPKWAKMYREHAGIDHPRNVTVGATESEDALSLARFRDNDELRFSLRSVKENAPWFNKIYIVSNCAPPAWLDTACGSVVWVDHSEIIPSDFLPTFNSHTIESFLHRIPGLSEQFIYMNDDVFLMAPLRKSNFFTPSGLSVSWLEGYGMVSGDPKIGDPDYLNAARNSADLLRRNFGFSPTELHCHVPFSLRRSVIEEIEALFMDRFDEFRVNRFRRINDINLTSFLYHHFALSQGAAIERTARSLMIRSNDLRWRDLLNRARSRRLHFLCINEGGALDPSEDWNVELGRFLDATFPDVPEWEKS